MRYIRVRNWSRWQSYRSDRGQPPWIKVHRRVLRDVEWVGLTDAQRGQLVAIWLLAADRDGVIPASPAVIRKLCHMDADPDLQLFVSLGFLESDANMTSPRRQHDRPEAEAEAEEEQSTSTSHARAREGEPWDELDPIAVASIRGLYGWNGAEGTDGMIWRDVDVERRGRMLTIAVQRLVGEGRTYNGALFRKILTTVIREQSGEPAPAARRQRGDRMREYLEGA